MAHLWSRLFFRLLLLAGIVGPHLFAATVVVVGSLRPDYSHVNQFMSELGEAGGQFAWLIKYFGFMLPAVFILIFVLAFRTRFPGTALSSIGTSLLVVLAVSMLVAGVFPCDVGCSPPESTPDQKLHDLFSILAFPSFTAGVFFLGSFVISQWQLASFRNLYFGNRDLVTRIVDSNDSIGGIKRRYWYVPETIFGCSFSLVDDAVR